VLCKILKAVEKLGGMVQCIAQRESIAYFVDVLRVNLEEAMDILADAVLSPAVLAEEVEDAKAAMMFMRDNMPAEVVSRDVRRILKHISSEIIP
jgi:predicted Zn-dependent peptidase